MNTPRRGGAPFDSLRSLRAFDSERPKAMSELAQRASRMETRKPVDSYREYVAVPLHDHATTPSARGESRITNHESRKPTPDPRHRTPDPRVSVIVPTYNERDSLPLLVARLVDVAPRQPIEVVIVDDGSPDGTGQVADDLANGAAVPITVIHRAGKAGLTSAVVAGAAAARGDVLSVMDADLSHPPELLPVLAAAVRAGADVAVASRYVSGGGVERWPLPRRIVSRLATSLARSILHLRVRDPLSGFFAARRELLVDTPFVGRGYKLLVEVLSIHPRPRVTEVPYRFVDRQVGHSKLDYREIWAFLRLLVRLRLAPPRIGR